MADKLRIGKINFANLFPIFHYIETQCDCSEYEFVEGPPSVMNDMLREGAIDVSTSSSVVYLKNEKDFIFIEGHSISSIGPIRSILLFSRVPIQSLDGNEILTTSQSETSPVLLDIVLRKFYGVNATLRTESLPISEAKEMHGAFLLIGDDALLLSKKAKPVKMKTASPDFRLVSIDYQMYYVYDLGEIWHRQTGLPFVFALWIMQEKRLKEKMALFERLKSDLDKAKAEVLPRFDAIKDRCPICAKLGASDLLKYWNGISYDLGPEHLRSLRLFGDYARELHLL